MVVGTNIYLTFFPVAAPGTGKVGPWPYLKIPNPTSGPTTGLTLDS
jgi:hypothetical protein